MLSPSSDCKATVAHHSVSYINM